MMEINKKEWERHRKQLEHLRMRLKELSVDVGHELKWMEVEEKKK